MSFLGRTPATPTGEEQRGTTLFFQVCRTALYLCAAFLGPERVQETVVTSIGLRATQLQYEVGHCLVSELCPGGETSQPQGCSPEPRREREVTRQGWAGWEPGGMGAGQLVLRHGLPSWLPARSFSFPRG